MDVRYKIYDEDSTEQQALVKGNYDKIHSIDGNVKMIESYWKDILTSIKYNLDPEDSELELLNEFKVMVSRTVSFAEPKQPLGTKYIQYRRYYFRNGNLGGRGQYLFDSNDVLICEQGIDKDTMEPIFEDTTKYLHIMSPELLGGRSSWYFEITFFNEFQFDVQEVIDGIALDDQDCPSSSEFSNYTFIDVSYFIHARLEE